MTASSPASQAAQVLPLRDITLPAAPSFWPLTPAWWAVITVVIVLLIIAIILISLGLKKRKQKQKLKQEQAVKAAKLTVILSELEKIHQQYLQAPPYAVHHFAQAISNLLKRFVRHHIKAPQAANLQGQAWINYLSGRSQITKEQLEPYVRNLKEASYNPAYELSSEKINEIVKLTRQIIEKMNAQAEEQNQFGVKL